MKSNSLQVSRGVAALLVLVHHLLTLPLLYFNKESFFSYTSLNHIGDFAVYYFFALSGYVLTMSVNRKDISPFNFIKDRVVRIYPEYIFWFIVYLAVWFAFYGVYVDYKIPSNNAYAWISNITLIPPLLGQRFLDDDREFMELSV